MARTGEIVVVWELKKDVHNNFLSRAVARLTCVRATLCHGYNTTTLIFNVRIDDSNTPFYLSSHPLHKMIISTCHCLIHSIIGGPPFTILVISIDHSYPHLVMVQYPGLHKQMSRLWCARLASPHYSALLFRGIFWFFSHDLQCLPLFFGRLMRSVHVDLHHHRKLLLRDNNNLVCVAKQ